MTTKEAQELAKVLIYLADAVRVADMIRTQNCCNSCGKMKDCEYRPAWGEPTRINCPLWEVDQK